MSEDFTQNETHLASGWEECAKTMETRSGGMFLKVEDGKSVYLNLVGKPSTYEKEFTPGEGMRARTKIDVWIPGDEKFKTWDMSNTVWKQLLRHFNRRGVAAMDKAVFELGREGTGKESKYWLEYLRDLSEDELRARSKLLPF